MQEGPFRICQHKLEFNFRDAICELIEPGNKFVHAPLLHQLWPTLILIK